MTPQESTPGAKEIKISLPVAIVFGALVIAGSILITNKGQAAPVVAKDGAQAAQEINIRKVSAQDHIMGSPNAKVILVEYSDFECPYCAMISPTLKKIVADSNGQVAWVFRNSPLPESMHPEARPAAEAAECVAAELGNDAYWSFSDSVFTNQKDMGPAFYRKTAISLGANPQQFDTCVSQKTYTKRITDDSAEASSNGGNGVPFVIVTGKKGKPVSFSGGLPEIQIQTMIKAQQ